MQPLNKLQLQKFIRYPKYQKKEQWPMESQSSPQSYRKVNKEPGTSSEVHFSNSQVGSSGQSRPSSPTPSLFRNQKFTKQPGASTQVHFSNPPVKSSGQSGPSPAAHRHPFRKKDYYQENKYVTDKINNYEQSKKQILVPPQPKAATVISKPDTPRNESNPTSRTVQSQSPNPDFKPSVSDKTLLIYLLEMKFLSMDQVERKFLNNQQTAGSFRNLLAGGYIKSKDGASNPNSLIIPTEKAYELLKVENPDKDIPKPVKRVFDPAVNHDLKLVELRFRFEQLKFIKKWYSERSLEEVPMMNRLFKDLPDACCKKNNDKSYFLELEISRKSPKVYEERIKEYERILEVQEIKEYGIEGVIFLCTDEKVHNIIKSKLPNSKSFSCMMLSRYLKEKESAA